MIISSLENKLWETLLLLLIHLQKLPTQFISAVHTLKAVGREGERKSNLQNGNVPGRTPTWE